VDISAKPKYILSYVTESKGKHRNSNQQLMARLCKKCGEGIYRYIGSIDSKFNKPTPEGIKNKTIDIDKAFQDHIKQSKEYEGISVKDTKSIYENETYSHIEVKYKKTKERLLCDKLKQINDLFNFSFLARHDDIEVTLQVLKCHHFIEELLLGFNIHVSCYTINPNFTWVLYDDSYNDSLQSNKLSKYLKQVKTVYLDKMSLDDMEFRKIVIDALLIIYEKITRTMTSTEAFIIDDSIKIIEVKNHANH